jgi:hypothetical protein
MFSIKSQCKTENFLRKGELLFENVRELAKKKGMSVGE